MLCLFTELRYHFSAMVINEDSRAIVQLRLAESADLRTVFTWRNDPWLLSLSANQKRVSLEEHTTWFQKTLHSDDHLLYIIESKIGEKMGTLRFDRDGDSAQVSIYLLRPFVGKGRGKRALTLGCRVAFAQWPTLASISATIRKDNDRSVRTFSNVGFRTIETAEEGGHPVSRMELTRAEMEE